MKPVYWAVPKLWPGETVAIIGGGPSLTSQQVEDCRGKVRVITINDALRLAPWCDVHYFCDDKWWKWHHKKDWYRNFAGLRITLENLHLTKEEPALKSVQNVGRPTAPRTPAEVLCTVPTGVIPGQNSGYQCINLAVHLGVKRIVLLGYDMRSIVEQGRLKTHWFGDHPGGTSDSIYRAMLGHFPRLVAPLAELGVEVLNCTPDSALGCFPKRELGEVLESVRHEA